MSCVNVQEVLEALAGSDVSSTARLVAVLEACGVTSPADLQRLTGTGERMVRKAKTELKCRNQSAAGTRVPEPECRSGTIVPFPAPEFRNQSSDLAPAQDSRVEDNNITTNQDKITTPLPPQADEPKATKAKRRSKRQGDEGSTRGSRLGRDWQLPADWREWAKTNCFASDDEITRQAETFRDYWIAKPGAQANKLDWEATWRNWCRNAFSSAGRHTGQVRQPQNTGRFNDSRPAWAAEKDARKQAARDAVREYIG